MHHYDTAEWLLFLDGKAIDALVSAAAQATSPRSSPPDPGNFFRLNHNIPVVVAAGGAARRLTGHRGVASSFTGFLPPRPARSPRDHRCPSNDRAMANLLGERRPLLDHVDGPAVPARDRMTRILVVEDQTELQRALRINLRARMYEVMNAGTGREALALATSWQPDAVILDLGLPDIGGDEVIVELRRWYRRPIIVLSGRTSPADKVGALDAGADDYVTKPFGMGELLARLRAALRRDEGSVVSGQAPDVVIGRWRIDLTAHRVSRAGAGTAPSGCSDTLHLTPTEWALLEPLLRHPGQLVGATRLLTGVWGPGFQRRTNYLRFHMAQLRRKLEDNPGHPRHLLTEHGMGYRYQP